MRLLSYASSSRFSVVEHRRLVLISSIRQFEPTLRSTSMWLRTSCLLEFDVAVATPFLLKLRPRSGWFQWVSREQYVLSPSVPAVEFTDPFGNLCQRLVAPPGPFSIFTSADIKSADSMKQSETRSTDLVGGTAVSRRAMRIWVAVHSPRSQVKLWTRVKSFEDDSVF